MNRVTIDAVNSHAHVRFGARNGDFVVIFPDADVEIVFTHSGGSMHTAFTLAGGVGLAMAEKAASLLAEMVDATVTKGKEMLN